MGIVDKIADNIEMKKLDTKVKKVLQLDGKFSKMSDEELKQKSIELQQRAKNGETKDSLMVEAFALVREASYRVLGMKQYPVQVKGAIALAEGKLAEMATGEGKTIVAPLASYLHALDGKNVHVITSNEYLAERDSEQMSKLFGFLGMTVGLSTASSTTEQKQQAYGCNITYTTNTELGFDYLRDKMAASKDKQVLRGLNSIIIDEADDTLLDQASTPLIIAQADAKTDKVLIQHAAYCIEKLIEDEDYVVDSENGIPSFSESGITKIEEYFHIDNLFSHKNSELVHFCNNALKAHTMFNNNEDYLVSDGTIQIIDQNTGRVLEGRKFADGIHQAIEAKERVKITDETKTSSTINFQSFFRLYDNVAGMSGTCKTDEEELFKFYGLQVVQIETNKPRQRVDEHFRLWQTTEARNQALKQRIIELHQTGRPILLGVTTVEKSLELAELLTEMGLDFNLLNASNDKEESKIIAQAGRLGAITIATNMAGRGTDIKLGGNATFMAKEEMQRRGYSEKLISFADSHLSPTTEEEKEARKTFIELEKEYKKITDLEKKRVTKAGGLAVIGTELNASRRVDGQLRGRAGRQGEPGSSEFFVAFEDVEQSFDVLNSDNFKTKRAYRSAYEKAISGLDPTEEITNKKAIEVVEAAQIAQEGSGYSQREQTVHLSEAENRQREAFYEKRQHLTEICDAYNPTHLERMSREEIFNMVENIDFNNIDEQTNLQDLEKYMLEVQHSAITRIVSDYYNDQYILSNLQKDAKVDIEQLSPADKLRYKHIQSQKIDELAKQTLRTRLAQFGLAANILSDEHIEQNSPEALIQLLSVASAKTLFMALSECSQNFEGINLAIKGTILNTYDTAWASHLNKITRIREQFNCRMIPQMSHEVPVMTMGTIDPQMRAWYDYIKEMYSAYSDSCEKMEEASVENIVYDLFEVVKNIRQNQAEQQTSKSTTKTTNNERK